MSYSICFLALSFLIASTHAQGYYWREYKWKIPDDALVAGKDIKGNNVYIGQAFFKDKGLVPCRIVPGEKEVTVPWGGVNKVNKDLKILCGNAQNFEWVTANYGTLPSDLIGKRPVLGGSEDGGSTYVGRAFYQQETKVGKVAAFLFGFSYLFFADEGQEKRLENYEVLVLKDKQQSGGVDPNDKVIETVFGTGR